MSAQQPRKMIKPMIKLLSFFPLSFVLYWVGTFWWSCESVFWTGMDERTSQASWASGGQSSPSYESSRVRPVLPRLTSLATHTRTHTPTTNVITRVWCISISPVQSYLSSAKWNISVWFAHRVYINMISLWRDTYISSKNHLEKHFICTLVGRCACSTIETDNL